MPRVLLSVLLVLALTGLPGLAGTVCTHAGVAAATHCCCPARAQMAQGSCCASVVPVAVSCGCNAAPQQVPAAPGSERVSPQPVGFAPAADMSVTAPVAPAVAAVTDTFSVAAGAVGLLYLSACSLRC